MKAGQRYRLLDVEEMGLDAVYENGDEVEIQYTYPSKHSYTIGVLYDGFELAEPWIEKGFIERVSEDQLDLFEKDTKNTV